MKKAFGSLMALGLVMMVACVASANTIVVPFFNDGGGIGADQSGMKTYIRVKNLDAATITCAIEYTDFNGVAATPTPNTFDLGPKATIAFRPVASDAASEGDPNPVPNAVTTGTTFGTFGGGGCEISSTGSILGMVSQEDYFVGSGGGSGIAPAQIAP